MSSQIIYLSIRSTISF